MEFIEELSKLQDSVPPFPFADAETIIQRELGAPSSEVSTTSRSTGGVGVHRPSPPVPPKNGEEVAVKVQRPGIRALSRWTSRSCST